MNKDQARDFVKQTFTQAFDKARFLDFTKNLVNHLDESKAASMQVPNAFKAHVRSCTRLGTYKSPKGELADVLVVNTTEPEKIERTRTALRDFVAHKLKREEDYKEAGIVAFVSPDERNWRFSYIRMEYQSKRDPNTGKIVAEERVTPARRFSYIVGEGESCHTAQARFLNLLQDTDHDPTLSEIEEAFSVEVVTKEFFTQYVKLFERINEAMEKLAKRDKSIGEEFKSKAITTVDFAKKLMGQIVFLYFLQKKGWLGVDKGKEWGTGPRNFLRKVSQTFLSEHPIANLFNDVFEPLFYDTLATDRGHEAWCDQFNCRIPFLNGGLFEPLASYDWQKTDIILPNELFTNDDYIDVGISGTGVLDVFDRYNFTVNEAEPLETEVAIDPEMLGKVFENLIEDNRRKGLGAYYTPREIVHYMCQESLINYLDNALNQVAEKPIVKEEAEQEKLFGKKAPKQAALRTMSHISSVPREAIETFVHLGEQISNYESVNTAYDIKMPKSIKDKAKLIDEKLHDITVCDPAVGSGAFLVMMMIEIVRARLALSPYFTDVNERTPYHFKRHAILNSLYGVDIDAGAVEIAKLRLWLSLVVDEEDVKQIKPLPNLDYRVVEGNSLIGLPDDVLRDAEIESQLERLRKKLGDETDNERKREYREEIKKRVQPLLDSAEHYAGYKVNFDFRLIFSEVFHGHTGFDIVLANPPYVRQEKLKDQKSILSRLYGTYTGASDLYVYFYERAVKLLNSRGTVSFISSNKFFRAGYGEKLRKFLTRETAILNLIDFGDLPIFEATTYPCVLIAKKVSATQNHHTVHACTIKTEEELKRFEEVFRTRAMNLPQISLQAEGWRIEDGTVLTLLDKLKKAGPTLGEHVKGKIYYGIKTGFNEAFVIGDETKKKLIKEDKKSDEVIKPFLRGRDIKRYAIQMNGLSLIYIPYKWTDENRSNKSPELFFKERYPAIHKHLKQFEKSLRKRDDQGDYWWEMRPCKYLEEFETPRIIWGNLGEIASFSYDKTCRYLSAPACILPDDGLFLLGLLNSRIADYYFHLIAAVRRGGYLEYKPMYVSQLPIVTPSESQRHAIEQRVERILAAKQRDPDADTSAMEREIDQLVYQLYGLTGEEIKIVEGKG